MKSETLAFTLRFIEGGGGRGGQEGGAATWRAARGAWGRSLMGGLAEEGGEDNYTLAGTRKPSVAETEITNLTLSPHH